MNLPRLIIIDDDDTARFALNDFFGSAGYAVTALEGVAELKRVLEQEIPAVVIADFRLRDGTALDVLRAVHGLDATVPVFILTAYASYDLAVKTVKQGAENFMTKPAELSALRILVEKSLEARKNSRKLLIADKLGAREVDPFAGKSVSIRALKVAAVRALDSDSPVLIQGETGTGKSILAGWMHRHGPRKDEPFVDVNCASLAREFLESELFGHEKGAFTGAVAGKQGLLEIAHRGSVFLDEIADADPAIQPKLLKVLEEKRFRRLGDVRDRIVDIRLIAATNQDLKRMVAEKKFRSDLYFRINTIELRIPPLRERLEDIETLSQNILSSIQLSKAHRDYEITPEALELLKAYAWPGNIRELRNVLERAALLSDEAKLAPELFKLSPAESSSFERTDLTLEELQDYYIYKVLQEEHGQVDRAAVRLGISRSTLYNKLKSLKRQI